MVSAYQPDWSLQPCKKLSERWGGRKIRLLWRRCRSAAGASAIGRECAACILHSAEKTALSPGVRVISSDSSVFFFFFPGRSEGVKESHGSWCCRQCSRIHSRCHCRWEGPKKESHSWATREFNIVSVRERERERERRSGFDLEPEPADLWWVCRFHIQ